MIESIMLGIIQGIAEWLPVSSEGLIVLAQSNIFHHESPLQELVHTALFLHLGTVLAASIYFRKDILALSRALLNFRQANQEDKNLIQFLLVSTLLSGCLGLVLLKTLEHIILQFEATTKIITLAVGLCLLMTAYLELRSKHAGYREPKDSTLLDGILLGIAQGFAALPGLSRSGLTVPALLLRKFDKAPAIRMSFLMSIPIVLAGNVLLNLKSFAFSLPNFLGLFFSFAFGLATIHILLRVAQKVNFGYFVLFFGILTILSVLI